MSVSVEEASCELVADLQGWRSTEETYLRIGRDAFGSCEYLKGNEVALGLHNLCETACNRSKLVIGCTRSLQGDSGLGDGLQVGIDFLICFTCHCSREVL